ncbi:LacI family transcriptional regulator [Lentzea fradiae]|uniref:LacI family transcriptional regulator n=1 Tax=Lentzea fradiae TaxID=200378 RepID=A0A1G7UKP5_9PSEU|nr:LacI family transcriptional regulator [Lentzea fradiae]
MLSRDTLPGESTPALAGIGHAAHRAGSGLLLCADLDFVQSRDVPLSGCVLLDRTADEHDLTTLIEHAIPFVSIGRREVVGTSVPCVDVDYAAGVRDLVARTAALGHRQIVYIGMPSGAASVERLHAFRAAVAEFGVHGRHAPAVWLDQVLRLGVTAVIAEHPDDAAGLIAAARRRNLSVPGDLSVMTLDTSEHDPQGITGVRVPRWETGRRAVHLLARLPQRAPQVLVECEFVGGTTLAAPRPPAR